MSVLLVQQLRTGKQTGNFRLLWPCIMNVGWRERNQQDATNLMFIIKLLSQHVSGIMPIIRRTRECAAAYGVVRWLWWLWLCGAGTRAVCTMKESNSNLHSAHSSCPSSTQPQPSLPAQNTIRGSAHSFSWWLAITMPETCSDKSLIINIRLVASCSFLSLHPTDWKCCQCSEWVCIYHPVFKTVQKKLAASARNNHSTNSFTFLSYNNFLFSKILATSFCILACEMKNLNRSDFLFPSLRNKTSKEKKSWENNYKISAQNVPSTLKFWKFYCSVIQGLTRDFL